MQAPNGEKQHERGFAEKYKIVPQAELRRAGSRKAADYEINCLKTMIDNDGPQKNGDGAPSPFFSRMG